MKRARVLVVEDEVEVREVLVRTLEGGGYEVASAAEGREALDVAHTFCPQVALVDVGLPGDVDGLFVGRRLHQSGQSAVVFVSGAGAEEDRLAGFDVGADDYITKPFSCAEILARVRAVLRRTDPGASEVWRVGDLVLDEAAHRVTAGGEVIELTPIEFTLLRLLVRQRGRVVTKEEILTEVWGHAEGGHNLVQVHMSALRRKLAPLAGDLVRTVRGTGYVLRWES